MKSFKVIVNVLLLCVLSLFILKINARAQDMNNTLIFSEQTENSVNVSSLDLETNERTAISEFNLDGLKLNPYSFNNIELSFSNDFEQMMVFKSDLKNLGFDGYDIGLTDENSNYNSVFFGMVLKYFEDNGSADSFGYQEKVKIANYHYDNPFIYNDYLMSSFDVTMRKDKITTYSGYFMVPINDLSDNKLKIFTYENGEFEREYNDLTNEEKIMFSNLIGHSDELTNNNINQDGDLLEGGILTKKDGSEIEILEPEAVEKIYDEGLFNENGEKVLYIAQPDKESSEFDIFETYIENIELKKINTININNIESIEFLKWID